MPGEQHLAHVSSQRGCGQDCPAYVVRPGESLRAVAAGLQPTTGGG